MPVPYPQGSRVGALSRGGSQPGDDPECFPGCSDGPGFPGPSDGPAWPNRYEGPAGDGRAGSADRTAWTPVGGGGPRAVGQPVARAQLASLIQQEIIPRLARAHRDYGFRAAAPCCASDEDDLRGDEVVEFTTILSARSYADAASYVEALRAQGNPLNSIFLHLFAPAARRLGEGWKEDRLDFVDVTMGLSRLQQLLRTLAPTLGDEGTSPLSDAPRALLGPALNEQHTFGIFMVGEFFRRSGWCVADFCANTLDDMAAAFGDDWYDVAGFSLSRQDGLAQLAAQIESARTASRNRKIRVMVGGRVFTANPHLAVEVGANGTAADGELAVRQAEFLIGRRHYPIL